MTMEEKEGALEWMKCIQTQELEEWEQQRELALQQMWESKFVNEEDVYKW